MTAQPDRPAPRAVVISGGPLNGRSFELDRNGADVFVGRSPLSELWLEDRSISPFHARLRWHGPDLVLRDLGSSSGTWINGRRLAGARYVRDDDSIAFGDIE